VLITGGSTLKREPQPRSAVNGPKLEFPGKSPVGTHKAPYIKDGAVFCDYRTYKTEAEVESRAKMLRDRYFHYKDSIEKEEKKTGEIRKEMEGLAQRKDKLRKLGPTDTDPYMSEIIARLRTLSDESKKTYKKLQEDRARLASSKQKYLHFENKDKKEIIRLLKSRLQPKPIPALVPQQQQHEQASVANLLRAYQTQYIHLFQPVRTFAEAKLRATQIDMTLRLQNMPVDFRNQLSRMRQVVMQNFRNILSVDDDEEDEDEDYGENGHGIFAGMGDMYNRQRRLQMNDRIRADALQANVYSMNGVEDNSSLRDLLASVKKVEEQKEGESQTPEGLTVNLLTHQKYGLHWLELAEDDDKKKGGLLADDMGLGKTVQLIALMLSHKADAETEYKTNLVICPVALMNQWEAEIEMKVKQESGLSVFIYHSVKQKYSFEQLKKYDVVITSYTTLATEYKKHIRGVVEDDKRKQFHEITKINNKKEEFPTSYHSPFFTSDAKFYRTILDEVQWIKNKATNASLSVTSINSHFRWCLSGTPLQNKIDELYPYMRFLRIKPYNQESRFRFDILNPLKSRSEQFDSFEKDKAMSKVRILLKAILLRREKNSVINGKPILQLPGKEVKIEELNITTNSNEASFYYSMEKSSADKVRAILDGPKAKGNYSSILTLLLRLRQAAIHSELVRIGEKKQGIMYDDEGVVIKDPRKVIAEMCESAKTLKEPVINRINLMEKGDDGNRFRCPICIDSPPDEEWSFFAPCGHGVCNECIDSFFEQRAEVDPVNTNGKASAKCTECRVIVEKEHMISYDIFDRICNRKQSREVVEMVKEKELKEAAANQKDEDLVPSSIPMSPKFQKALDIIKNILENHPNEKVIVFSQFTTMFSLFVPILNDHDIDPLLYVGSMNATARNETVKEFYRNENKRVLLISMKAGNVGLTLTCANHVIIMDPFWNPYVEEQAQDRAYRIGQFRPVKIYRILVKDSVEDRIMELQKKKKELIESALDEKGRNHVSGLNREEIGHLFGIRDL
jgi:SNF2 family DNA or RNA helicase